MDTTENYKTMDQIAEIDYAELGKRYKIYKRGATGGNSDNKGMSLNPEAKMYKIGTAVLMQAYKLHYIFNYGKYCECISKQDLYAGHYAIKEIGKHGSKGN